MRPELKGQVVLICDDDLEKTVLDQIAYNGKGMVVGTQRRLGSTSNYDHDRKVIVSSALILTKDTKANHDREENRRKPLKRYKSSLASLPLKVRRELLAVNKEPTAETLKEVEVTTTDRSGIPFAMIKNWIKMGGSGDEKHGKYSQPSTAVQHVLDLSYVLACIQRPENPEKYARLREYLCDRNDNSKVVPYIILTTDGAGENTARHLQNVLPLVALFVKFDLDGIELHHYCPGHSKENPVEMLNRSEKRPIKGRVISSGNGTRQDMEKAKKAVASAIESTTHAGEPIHAIVVPAGSMPWKGEQERSKYEPDIIPHEELLAFVRARRGDKRPLDEEGGDWDLNLSYEWIDDDNDDRLGYADLEKMTKLLHNHLRHHSIYGVIILSLIHI